MLLPRLLKGACALLLASLAAATAQACTGVVGSGGNADLVINTWDETAADMLISSWTAAGNANFLNGCSTSSPSPVTVTPAMPVLQFVRTVVVDGESFPAFAVVGKPNTPLFVFRYVIGNGGSVQSQPFDASRVLNSPGTGTVGNLRWSVLQIAAVSRGGQMVGLPTTSVGSATHVYPPNPSLTKVESFSVTATLRTKTCTLGDATVTLDETHAADLPAAGRTTGDQDFKVVLECNGVFPVSLQLTDANLPGNTGSRLTPTRNATATGVRVQLLREGAPVQLGQSWPLPTSHGRPQDIPLSARYYREAGAFGAGLVEGQAVITATYR